MPKQIDSLAMVYARSLFELAEEAGGQEKIVEVGEELEQICELIRGDRRLGEFIRSPIIERGARQAVINRMFSDRMTDLTLRFLLVLNDKGRLGHIEAITAGYDQLLQEQFGRIEVDVFTPEPLDSERQEKLRARIERALGKEPVLYPYTDADMIGGIKLRIGDQLIDASVATRLRRLRDHLLSSGGSALRERIAELIEEEQDK
ncbi:MAG: ATP synthase F1 subunit delta [Planctomycetota bacterium]|jgi:F-type H+-transporting ATPase subunit delta